MLRSMVDVKWHRDTSDGTDCKHDFSVKREVETELRPAYIRGPFYDRFCALCGTKETLTDRLRRVEKTRLD